uniref:Uncharacterized protein n=1 Tax=Vespula pensylvanica TaxID=30213 RepID=A0A834K0R5_VESPE|nr:hypothetical protein H0235_015994 [Vespula pensylvanica]
MVLLGRAIRKEQKEDNDIAEREKCFWKIDEHALVGTSSRIHRKASILKAQSRGALALDRVTSCVPRLVRGVKGPLRKSLFQPQRWSSSDGANDGAGGEGRRWSEVVGLGGRLTHKGGAR